MTKRALLLAGAVLPIGILPHSASASVLQVPQFATSAPLLTVQADTSAERLAARERYETALERYERAREALRDAEQAGGGLDAEQLAAEQAEEELAAARRALVEFVMYDVPRTALEEQALRDERAAQDDLAAEQARSESEDASDVLADSGTSETSPDEAGDPAEQREPQRESAALEEEDPGPEAAAEELTGEAAEAEDELASSPGPDAAKEMPGTLTDEGRSIDPGLTREERRQIREERRAAEREQQAEAAEAIVGETVTSESDTAEPSSSEVPRLEEQGTGSQDEVAEEVADPEVADRSGAEQREGDLADGQSQAAEESGPEASDVVQPEIDPGLTRDERRRIREERRAAAEQPPEEGPVELGQQDAPPDESRAVSDEAPRPSLAERLMGMRGDGAAKSGREEDPAEADDIAAKAETSEPVTGQDGLASGMERDRPGLELGLTREERRQAREARRLAAEQGQSEAGEDAGAALEGEEEGSSSDVARAEAEEPGLLRRLFGGAEGAASDESDVAAPEPGGVEPDEEADVVADAVADDQADSDSAPSVDRDREGMPAGLSREERRRIREERRAEAGPGDAERAESEAEGGELGDERAADDQARRPSMAERLMGRRTDAADEPDSSAGTAEDEDQVARAEPSEPTATEEADQDRLEADRPERGMTREERRRLREERRAAQEGRGAESVENAPDRRAGTEAVVPGERPSLAERLARNRAVDEQRSADTADDGARGAPRERGADAAAMVTAEELQERRRERREARREERGDRVTLNQIFQNQTVNQNQATIDRSVNTNQTIDQSVSEQTVQQQQVIEERRGMAANRGGARPSPLERIRRREERLARLEAEGRERELTGELRATQRELDRTREELRDARLQRGDEVIRREADRIIVRRGSEILVLRGDNENRFGLVEDVERFDNGYVRTVAARGGIRIVTLYDREGGIVRRSRILPSGQEMVLIDAEPAMRRQERRQLEVPPVIFEAPREVVVETRRASTEDIEIALAEPPAMEPPRAFTLDEVRYNEEVRDLVPRVDLDTITFEFDSAAIPEDQLITLEEVGIALEDILFENPNEVFLIEGHTDAPGSDVYNLALSDRRAEAVAVALSQNFDVPPENLVTQGYGEEHLKIPTLAEERQNRRVSIRRITDLVNTAQAQ